MSLLWSFAFKKSRALRITLSQAAGTPTPTWWRTISLLASNSTELHATFESFRLVIPPMAIGRIVSLISFSTIRLALQMYFEVVEAAVPGKKMLTTDVKDDSRQLYRHQFLTR